MVLYSSGRTVSRLEAIAGSSLDDVPADTPYVGDGSSPLLGIYEGTAYALLYNGILGDRSVTGGNVLTSALLDRLCIEAGEWPGPMVIYGEASRLGAARLKDAGVTFKQTPYDVRAR